MKKLVLLFVIVLGMVQLTYAQDMTRVEISSDFQLTLTELPSSGSIEFDISQFNFTSERQARRVIGGIGSRNVTIDLDNQLAQLQVPMLGNGDMTMDKAKRIIDRLSAGMLRRSARF